MSVLWVTFRTNGIIQEHMSYNIEQHLSIASEYVKSLVLDHGGKTTIDKQAATANSLTQLKERVEANE